MTLIKLEDIRKTYAGGDTGVTVLHGISLEIQAGEFVAIMGASGSGKSTLMNILGLLDSPTSGHYLLDGVDVAEFNSDELAALRRRTFGFVFQNYNLISTSTARENVEMPAIYAGMSSEERKIRAEALLSELNLADRFNHRPNQLSGGQQQRVSIARALINGGRIILADEPTGALDSQSGEDVMLLLRRMHEEGHTIILITHAREVADYADRLIEIRDGNIIADSGAAEQHSSSAAKFSSKLHSDNFVSTLADVTEAIKMALRALRANVFRTVLTLLGIIIGVASVVTMLAIGAGAQKSILDQINAMGSDLLLVYPSTANFRGSGNIVTLVPEDAQAITNLPNINSVIPEVSGSVTLRYGNADYQTQANGTVAAFTKAKSWPIEYGSFINSKDNDTYAPVAVLGQTVTNVLFKDHENPVGKYILVNSIPFQVIGVMSKKGADIGGSDQDDVIIVPLSTGNLRLFGQKHVRSITVQVKDGEQINTTQTQIQALLDERHKKQDTRIINMSSIRDDVAKASATLSIFLGSIAAISLLVGGIGVMNIMLVSVTERTREIGVRMATGARRRDIMIQFMIEALVVSTIGGLAGVCFGLIFAHMAQLFGLDVVFSLQPVLLAFSCAFFTGIIFGFLPAQKAARMQPAAALSAE